MSVLAQVMQGVRRGQQASNPPTDGLTRGSMGAFGSRPFVPRNSDAMFDKEREKIAKSPIMEAFMRRHRQRLLW